MADKKISELTAATSVSTTDVVPIVQGTTTKKITATVLFENIPSSIKYAGICAEVGAPDTVQSGAISTVTAITYLSNITTSSMIVTLADGIQGQEKTLLMTVKTTDNIVLTCTHSSFTNITFTGINQTAKLKFMNDKWNILSVYGATVN